MLRPTAMLGLTALALGACADQKNSLLEPAADVTELDPAVSDDVECIVDAVGTLTAGDRFIVHATRFDDGSAMGNAVYMLPGPDASPVVLVGDLNELHCSINGAHIAHIGGTGRVRGEAATISIDVVDDDDETSDFLLIEVLDPSGNTVFTRSGIPDRGDIVVTGF